MARWHLRERRRGGAVRFLVIRQLRARERNRPRNTIRAYRGNLTGFAAHHDGEIAGLTAAPVRAFLGEIAGQAPATRKRKRAAVASFCKWAVRHELLEASPMDRIEVPRTLPRPAAD